MGSTQAREIRTLLSQDAALRWHLQSNHFPPVHEVFVPVAKTAIEHAQHDEWDVVLDLPNGRRLTVSQIVEGLHLYDMIEREDDDDV